MACQMAWQELQELSLMNGKIIVRADQESAVGAIREDLMKKYSHVEITPEDAPKSDSQGNGMIEKAVQVNS